MNLSRAPLGVSLWVFATLLLAACESRPDRHAMMEEARHSVPPMAADEPFFDGAVIAHLTFGSDPGAGGGSDGERGGGHGEGGGGRHRGGGRGMGGGAGGMRQGGGQTAERSAGAPSPSMRASSMPPAMFRLRLENTTAAAIDVEVRGLDSELGNFAVRPDKLTLPPGQSVEPDPMESLLGVDTYNLPVTITLRIAGRTETKVLTLQLLKPAPGILPPPAGS